MRKRILVLALLAGAVLLLLSACNSRVAEPTAAPVVTSEPAGPVMPTTAPQPSAAPVTQAPKPTTNPDVADIFARPEMTVLGELESGIPFGLTENGHSFKGDPEAPVLITEFSEYQ
ncbi:MAG: hypothetical protein JXA37_06720 [Chloroflexia bacterium]|nr:hypothetical protein [Chloroflexia bacterium]